MQMIDLPTTASKKRWSRDGKDLLYIDVRADVANIWSVPIAGGPPKQLTKFTSDFIEHYAVSEDGKRFLLSRSTGGNDIVLIKGFR